MIAVPRENLAAPIRPRPGVQSWQHSSNCRLRDSFRPEVSAGTFVVPAPEWEMTSPTKQRSSRQVISRATIAKAHAEFFLRPHFSCQLRIPIGKAFFGATSRLSTCFPVELWGADCGARLSQSTAFFVWGKVMQVVIHRCEEPSRNMWANSRGVRCSSEQIIVTSGAQQALDLLARVLLDHGDEVWMEDPGYPGASQAFSERWARV